MDGAIFARLDYQRLMRGTWRFRKFMEGRRQAAMLRDAERAVAAFPSVKGKPHGLATRLVVSLTSHPPRFAYLGRTLRGLLDQTIMPDHVILWVGTGTSRQLPEDVLALRQHGLEIRETEDTRSFTKLLPALALHPDATIVTADDDIYYEPTWLEGLVGEAMAYPGWIVCHRAHLARRSVDGSLAPYATWELASSSPTDRGTDELLFPTGVGGVLYPPGSLGNSVQDRLYLELCPRADDLWFFWMAERTGTPQRTLGHGRPLLSWEGSQDSGLFHHNVDLGENDTQVANLERHFGVLPRPDRGVPPRVDDGVRISFLVPTFNRARYIGEALDSILSQSGPQDEVLVVDDGSTDDTASVLATYANRIKVLTQANAGKAVALNKAMQETTGRYVWICDDDDVLRPGVVDLLLGELEASGAGFVFGRYSRFHDTETGRHDDGTGYWPDLAHGNLPRHILEDAFVMQNAAMVRREAYEGVGPFSEAMLRSLDYEMFVRLATAVPCRYVDGMIFDQRKHEGARGPAAILHKADASDSVWLEYDRRIFQNLHAHVPLAFFEEMFRGSWRTRLALLQRGAIMARHACWPEALADFTTAAAVEGNLGPAERAVCSRAFTGKHLFSSLLASPELDGFRQLARSGNGRALVTAICEGTLWRLRRGTPVERKVTLKVLRELLGTPRTLRLVAGHQFRTGGAAPERREFPDSALLAPGTLPPVPGSRT